jgi:hypothetical protein
MSLDPRQLALQYKDDLNATGAFVVQPDGQVKMSADRGGGFAPPWTWAGAIPPASGNDPTSLALRVKLSTPASDPSSPWHDMYQGGGPFTKRSSWDSEKGTYEGGIDWPTLLGTIGVGGMFAAPALAALAGAGGGAAAAIPTTEGIASATSLGLPVTAGLGTAGTLGSAAAAAIPTTMGIPGAVTSGGLVAPDALPAVVGAAAPAASAPAISQGVQGSEGFAPGNTFANGIPGGSKSMSLLDTLMGGNSTVNAGIGLFGNLFGTKMATDANAQAAATQAAAVKYAADLADAQNKRAEAFSRQQAENQFQNTEASRLGNYNQWRAREARVSNLGAALGLSQRDIPNYVPGVDPRFTADGTQQTGGFTGTGGTGTPGVPAADVGSDPVMQALAKNYASLGASPTGPGSGPTDIQYFAQRIAQTGGLTPENSAYWFGPNGRIAKELAGAVPPEPVSRTQVQNTKVGTLGMPLTTNFWWS